MSEEANSHLCLFGADLRRGYREPFPETRAHRSRDEFSYLHEFRCGTGGNFCSEQSAARRDQSADKA